MLHLATMPSSGATFAQRSLLLVGSLGPLGHMPASGTVSVAVVGVPLWWLLDVYLRATPAVHMTVCLGLTMAAVWIHHVGDRMLGKKDSSTLVWDEIVGFMIAVSWVPFSWPLAAIAFFLERGLDIAKIPPARQIENHWPGGWGVVGDDVVAGMYTCLILHLLLWLSPGLGGPLG